MKGHIYLIHAKGTSRYKIGLTTRTVEKRLAELNSSQSAYPLQLIASAKFPNVQEMEKNLHQKYRHSRVHGEWFEFSSREARAVADDIRGVESKFSFRWLLIAVAIAILLSYCQHFKPNPLPQESAKPVRSPLYR